GAGERSVPVEAGELASGPVEAHGLLDRFQLAEGAAERATGRLLALVEDGDGDRSAQRPRGSLHGVQPSRWAHAFAEAERAHRACSAEEDEKAASGQARHANLNLTKDVGPRTNAKYRCPVSCRDGSTSRTVSSGVETRKGP